MNELEKIANKVFTDLIQIKFEQTANTVRLSVDIDLTKVIKYRELGILLTESEDENHPFLVENMSRQIYFTLAPNIEYYLKNIEAKDLIAVSSTKPGKTTDQEVEDAIRLVEILTKFSTFK